MDIFATQILNKTSLDYCWFRGRCCMLGEGGVEAGVWQWVWRQVGGEVDRVAAEAGGGCHAWGDNPK